MKEISYSQQVVRVLLLEFLKNQQNIIPEKTNILGLSGFLHQTTLVSIVKKFLLPLRRNEDMEDELRSLIEQDFFSLEGISDFEDYRKTLELEKEKNGFQNLALLLIILKSQKAKS